MKGIRFYADYGDKRAKRRGGDAPNALAVYIGDAWTERGERMLGCAAAITDARNAPVCSTSASRAYIRESCKRISEAEAYRLHPKMRDYLASPALAGGGAS